MSGSIAACRPLALAIPADRVKIPYRGDSRPAGSTLLNRGIAVGTVRVESSVNSDQRPVDTKGEQGLNSPGGREDRRSWRRSEGHRDLAAKAVSRDGEEPIMKRQFVAGVLGLALAGCAHSRSDVAKGPDGSTANKPVAITPVPSIHDTINRGTGSPALAQTALGNPADPQWSGRAPAPGAGNPTAPAGTNPAPGGPAVQMAGANPSAAPAELSAAPASGARGLAPQPQPGVIPDTTVNMPAGDLAAAAAAAAGSNGLSPAANPSAAVARTTPGGPTSSAGVMNGTPPATSLPPAAGATSSASAIPYTLSRPGGPMPASLSHSTPSQAPEALSAAAGPPLVDTTAPAGHGPAITGLTPVATPPASVAPAGRAATDPSVNPAAGRAGQPATPGSQPAGDPLLGPNPDLMPDLPPLPAARAASASATAASAAAAKPAKTPSGAPPTPATGTAAAPADPPSLDPPAAPAIPPSATPSGDPAAASSAAAPAASPAAEPPPLGPPSADRGRDNSAAAGNAVQVVDLPPLEAVPPAATAATAATVARTVANGSGVPVRRAVARSDAQVVRTAYQPAAGRSGPPHEARNRREASIPVARVGDEVITLKDLKDVVRERTVERHINLAAAPPEDRKMIYKQILWSMIDDSLVVQEAKRIIHDPKHFEQFIQERDRYWKEVELPQLECQFAVDNEQALREKFKEHGRSLDVALKAFQQNWMAENFIHAKLKNRVKVDYPEMRKYYFEHMHDKKFDRPATIVWHEIVVTTNPTLGREAALNKIRAIQEQLQRGADFSGIAAAQSDGPARSREQGGLMETSPGSYGVPAVNVALETLPLGQVSGILEGPESFHIVRVDRRRAGGPAPFEELQDEIRSTLFEKKRRSEREAFMDRLRRENPVETFLRDMDREPESGRS